MIFRSAWIFATIAAVPVLGNNTLYARPPTVVKKIDCGQYELIGKLKHLGPARDILEIHSDTTRESSVILRHVDLDQELLKNGKLVRASVQITHAEKNHDPVGRVIGKLSSATSKDARENAIKLIKKSACSK